MTATGQDSLNTRATLDVNGKSYAYYSLAKAAEQLGDVSRLPFSMKVLLENLLRFEDGKTVTRADISTWKPGEIVLLSGKLLTGRDAAHKRLTDMLHKGESLPVDFRNRFIYYVGPVDAVRDEAVGPAGPARYPVFGGAASVGRSHGLPRERRLSAPSCT